MLKFDQKLVVDQPSKIVHFSGCTELLSIKVTRIKPVYTTLKDDYVYCPVCQTISYIFKANEQTNIDILNEFEIKYLLTNKTLYLQTSLSFWKIKYEYTIGKNRLVLYHGNFTPKSDDNIVYKSNCYHRQYDAKGYQDIPKILRYITDHDKFRSNPTSATTKNVSSGGKKQKTIRKRRKKSIQRARNKLTLVALENLKNESTNDK